MPLQILKKFRFKCDKCNIVSENKETWVDAGYENMHHPNIPSGWDHETEYSGDGYGACSSSVLYCPKCLKKKNK